MLPFLFGFTHSNFTAAQRNGYKLKISSGFASMREKDTCSIYFMRYKHTHMPHKNRFFRNKKKLLLFILNFSLFPFLFNFFPA